MLVLFNWHCIDLKKQTNFYLFHKIILHYVTISVFMTWFDKKQLPNESMSTMFENLRFLSILLLEFTLQIHKYYFNSTEQSIFRLQFCVTVTQFIIEKENEEMTKFFCNFPNILRSCKWLFLSIFTLYGRYKSGNFHFKERRL